MRRIVLLLLLTCSMSLYAQEQRLMPSSVASIQSEKAKFLLFPTQNIHVFLKLNTRTGEIFMVQYSVEGKERFEKKIDNGAPYVRKRNQENGRFFLYPTNNIYNFLLLDKIDGRVWQVQWGTEEKYCFYTRIYDVDSKLIAPKDSIVINNLSFVDNQYYYKGSLVTGFVLSNDGKTFLLDISDGYLNGIMALHDNEETAIYFDDIKEIEDEEATLYYDESHESMTLADFKAKYPKIIPRVKEAYKDLDKLKGNK